MERLTYDFAMNGQHCWQIKGAGNLECREVCELQEPDGCMTCPIAKAFDRLAEIENILGDNYDFDRLRELVEADGDGRCVVSPCKVGDRLYTIRTIQDGSFTLEVYDSGEIRQISVNTNGTFFLVDYGHSLSANNFGKTVFKTREAAESALKAMKEREKSETD